MTILDAIDVTRRVLDTVEVRGSENLRALSAAISNLDEMKKALLRAERTPGEEATDE